MCLSKFREALTDEYSNRTGGASQTPTATSARSSKILCPAKSRVLAPMRITNGTKFFTICLVCGCTERLSATTTIFVTATHVFLRGLNLFLRMFASTLTRHTSDHQGTARSLATRATVTAESRRTRKSRSHALMVRDSTGHPRCES